MKKLLLLVPAALAAAAFLSLTACVTVAPRGPGAPKPPRESVALGERTVNFKADHDVIGVGGYDGVFRSLYFVVEKNSIEIFNVVVTYGNGEKQRLETRMVFNEGSRSRTISFDGGKRRIKTIAFTYKTVGKWEDGRARVVVYGVR
jgi:predicted small secreted protein